MENKSINKDFWELKHQNKERYWLTGTLLLDILNFHKLTKEDLINKKILEIGVGIGDFSKEIEEYTNTENIICCDISENALNNVSEKIYKKYLTTDLKKIEPVDLAISHLVFQHCTDEEVERIINDVVLKDDGIFTFQFAYLRKEELPNNVVTNLVKLGSHHFRELKDIENIINKSNKKIFWVSESHNFYDPENFSWLIVKIKNK